MTSDAGKLFTTIVNAAYFSAAMAAFIFLFVTYSGATLISVPITLLTLTYVMAVLCAVACLVRRDFLVGSSVYVLSRPAQKIIRLSALLLPLPALVFTAMFANCLLTFNGSAAAVARVVQVSQIEVGVFGKSALSEILLDRFYRDQGSADVDFSPYIIDLDGKIKQHWSMTQSPPGRIVVQIKILRDGTLSNVALVGSSGSASADQSAIEAIKSCAPLRPLPGAATEDIDIQYTFE
ncbi:MAG TPA: energy transducer TonB [Trichormus sp.]